MTCVDTLALKIAFDLAVVLNDVNNACIIVDMCFRHDLAYVGYRNAHGKIQLLFIAAIQI